MVLVADSCLQVAELPEPGRQRHNWTLPSWQQPLLGQLELEWSPPDQPFSEPTY
jgi:hypothetical protein